MNSSLASYREFVCRQSARLGVFNRRQVKAEETNEQYCLRAIADYHSISQPDRIKVCRGWGANSDRRQ